MLVRLDNGENFCTGSMPFRNAPPIPDDVANKLIMPFSINEQVTEAVLDTGGINLVLNPEFVEQMIDLSTLEWIETKAISIRGSRYTGDVYRVEITLAADQGESIKVSVNLFVPSLVPGDRWPYPQFLGWYGCLELFRFAFDPREERLYFGVAD